MNALSENLKDLMSEAEIKTPALALATGIDSSTTSIRLYGLPTIFIAQRIIYWD